MRPVWTHLIAVAVGAGAALAAVGFARAPGAPDSSGSASTEAVDARELETAVSPRGGSKGLRGSDGATVEGLDATPDERRFLADALVRERARIEAARIRPEDSGVDVARRVFEERADPTALLADWTEFARHVRPVSVPPTRYDATGDVTRAPVGKGVEGPLVVEFGPGVFDVSHYVTAWEKTPNLTSIEVRGAGMDRTTLRSSSGSGLLSLRVPVPHVKVTGLTFDLGSSVSVLTGGGDLAALFEDVRFEGTREDRASAPIYLTGRAYLGCRRCEFRHLDNPIGVRGQAILLLDSCRFVDVTSGFYGWGGAARGTRARLVDGEWDDSPVAGEGLMHRGTPEYEIEVHGGRVHLDRAGLTDEERRSRWGARYVRESAPVEFGPSRSTRTLGAILDLLEKAPVGRDQVPTAVRYLISPRTASPRYLLSLYDRERKRTETLDVWAVPGGFESGRGSASADWGEPPPDALSLAEALRRSGVPLSAPVDRVQYGKQHDGTDYVASVGISWRSTTLFLKAADATPLTTPWPSSW